MRSKRAFIGAATVLLTYPAALAAGLLISGDAASMVAHLGIGAGFVIFASSVFDFGLPRWVNVLGAAAAGAFGGIFLLQFVSELTNIAGLSYLAFDILGHELERVLPDVVYVWFVALLLGASYGKSRYLGAAIMAAVVGLETLTLAGVVLGIEMPVFRFLVLLPFVWLLFESAKQQVAPSTGPGRAAPVVAGRMAN